jgi:1-phosphofructokinase family hexose kinase
MILTLLPNPALDRTLVVPSFQAGQSYRVTETLTLAGGKGFNFARALKTWEENVVVVAPVGGLAGRVLCELATKEGLVGSYVQTKGETRTCLTIIDTAVSKNNVTEINERGATLAASEWEALIYGLERRLASAQYLTVCGSFPPGIAEQGLDSLFKAAKTRQVPVFLDTYGPHLSHALTLGPALVKINQHEAGDIVAWDITNPAEALRAALELQQRGASAVIITLGKYGAVGVDATRQGFGWYAPEVNSVCAVGSGDVLFAGVVAALSQGYSLKQALGWGVAAGAANTLQIGAGLFDKTQFKKLLQQMQQIPGENMWQ